ncbi:M48 family metallopeptidase [Parafannyhessea umbonata]|uniref:M48 family metallopeptidase n=1 Tax=Parafannyhessea umbonata TaxID=604330 RepID=UPI003AB2F8AE
MPKTAQQTIRLGNIDVTVTRKRVSRVNLRVRRDGSVAVSAPARVPLAQVRAFVESREDWVRSARAQALARQAVRAQSLRDGGTTRLLGKTLALSVEKDLPSGSAPHATRTAGTVVAHVPRDDAGPANVDLALQTLWRATLQEVLPPLFARYEGQMGVRCTGVLLRIMTSRWGSCNVRTGRITLNLELACHPASSVESVVAHELCHLLEPSHNARFHALMDGFCPWWRDAKAELNSLPPTRPVLP